MRGARILLGLVLVVFPSAGARAAAPLTLDAVLASALEYYPQVRAAWEERAAREGKLLASRGAFDLRVEQEGFGHFSGFYDGRFIDNAVVKPLPYANAKLYGGYRISDGDFPIYENEAYTNDGGEIRVGLVLSLLRDRRIDERRFAVAESQLAVERADLDLAATRIRVQHAATSAYLRWAAAGQVVEIRRALVELARARQSLLTERVDAGDEAAISIEENQLNLLEREAQLLEAERDLLQAANALSLFVRDATATARVPAPEELPSALPQLPPLDTAELDGTLGSFFARRPEAAKIDNAIALEEQRLRLAENALLPRVDFAYELKNDFGGGSPTRDGADNMLALRIEIPLERRLGQGREAEARATLDRLAWERRLLEDRLRVEIGNLANEIHTAGQLVTTTTEQVDRALIVEQGERERLRAGASEIFLVNAREQATANARVRLLASRAKLQQALADFYAATVQLDRFYAGDGVAARP